MSTGIRRWTSLLAVVGGLVCFAVPTTGQPTDAVLEGRVLDTSGSPVAGIAVVLHRVTAEGGGVVAEATTDAEGRFRFTPGDSAVDGVYFAAVRHDGELHIGPMIRAPFTDAGDYVIRLGAEPAGATGSFQSPVPARRDESPLTPALVIGLLGVTGAAITVALARRPQSRRRLLIRLAQEEERDTAGDASATGSAR